MARYLELFDIINWTKLACKLTIALHSLTSIVNRSLMPSLTSNCSFDTRKEPCIILCLAMYKFLPKYKEGKLPVHTKNNFVEYEILTVHGIMTRNALLYKVSCSFSHLIFIFYRSNQYNIGTCTDITKYEEGSKNRSVSLNSYSS